MLEDRSAHFVRLPKELLDYIDQINAETSLTKTDIAFVIYTLASELLNADLIVELYDLLGLRGKEALKDWAKDACSKIS